MPNTNPVVILLADGLARNGYGGLCTPDMGCRCKLSYLVECHGDPTHCVPGHIVVNPAQPTDWVVRPGLPPSQAKSDIMTEQTSIKVREERRAANARLAASKPLREGMFEGQQMRAMYVVKATRIHKTSGYVENDSPWLLHGSRGEVVEISGAELKAIMGCAWIVVSDHGKVFSVPKSAHRLMPEI